MRIRQRNFSSSPRTRYVRLVADGTIIQTVHTDYISGSSRMEDVAGNFNGINHCSHITVRNDGGVGAFTVNNSEGPWIRHEPWFTDNCVPYAMPALLIPGGVDGFIKRGVESIKPKLKSDISLPNFLIELRDMKSLFSSITSAIGWTRGYKKRTPSGRRRRIDGADVASDVHLSANFGINPLVSDMYALATSWQDFVIALKNFKKHANQPLVSHYRENFAASPFVTAVYSGSQWIHYEESTLTSAAATLTLHYSYTPLVSIGHASISNYLRYIGFRRSNASLVAWNAIPFSFMVDWVLRVGDFLKQFDEGLVPVKMNITAACYSLKIETTHRQWLEGRGTYTLSPTPFRRCRQTSYTRDAVSPEWVNVLLSSPIPPRTDTLSVKEISLAVALGNKLR